MEKLSAHLCKGAFREKWQLPNQQNLWEWNAMDLVFHGYKKFLFDTELFSLLKW